jgi:predicted NBD/HSP70 family sugar kinase
VNPGTASPADGDTTAAVGRLDGLRQKADAGDAVARQVLRRSALGLARAVDLLAGLFDAELVVPGGAAWEPLAAHYQPVLDAGVGSLLALGGIHPVTAIGSTLGQNLGAIGAACLILNQAFAAQPSSLLVP